MAETLKKLNIKEVFSGAALQLETNSRVLRWFWLANMVFLSAFRFIDGGFSNPLSIVWLGVYYVYWCVFFRVCYHKKPYLQTKVIIGSIVPSTKIVFITLIFAFLLVLLPFLPLFMGFNNQYLLFFEKYMMALQNMEAGILNQTIFALILILVSPQILCRPYFAWIASLLGQRGSLRKAFRKTAGNNLRFMAVMFLLNLPCVIIWEADLYLGCEGWLAVAFYSIFFLYINLVFAKMYDFFYNTGD